jgi:hypothetical protein
LAAFVKSIFASNVKSKDTAQLQDVRARLEKTRELATGPYATWRPQFDDLLARITHVTALYRPKPRDFGLFAGVIACVSFIVLLAAIGLANRLFSLKLEGSSLVVYSAVLALIAGFGYGAVRFKGLLFGAKGDTPASKQNADGAD